MASDRKSTANDLAPVPGSIRSSGIRQSRRTQLPWDDDEFRILSIDGGGIRGILPARILAECERRLTGGRSAGKFFDLIAGTSTGGIIALGLGIGMTAQDILDLYLENGGKIFPPEKQRKGINSWIWEKRKFARDIIKVRYSPEALKSMLERSFGNRVYGDSSRRLVIPTFDAHTKINVLKTPHHPDFQKDWRLRLVDVALATSAAPTFLPPHRIGTQVYADGGIWANNPVMLALVEALTSFDVDRHKIRILSLGCGSGEIRMTEKQIERGGQLDWRTAINVAMELSSQNSDGQAGLLVGRERFLRLDQPDQVHPIALDDFLTAKAQLPAVGVELFEQSEKDLSVFFEEERAAGDAYYGPRAR